MGGRLGLLTAGVAIVCGLAWAQQKPQPAMPGYGRASEVPYLHLDPLPAPLRFHGSAILKGRVYVLGGIRGTGETATATGEVLSYPLESGGRLGERRKETSFPTPLAGIGQACVAWKDRVLLIAGGAQGPLDASTYSNRVVSAVPGEDGTITEWKLSDPWPGPAVTLAAVAVSATHVLVVGGVDEYGVARADVYRARIHDDGSLGEWSREADLPMGRCEHGAFSDARHLYAVGGREGRATLPANTVFASDLGTSSVLSPWKEMSIPMPYSVADGGSAFVNGTFYWFGGQTQKGENSFYLLTVRTLEKGLSVWETIRILRPAVRDVAMAVEPTGRRAYVTGGTSINEPHVPVDRVTVYALDPHALSGKELVQPTEEEKAEQPERVQMPPAKPREDYRPVVPVPRFAPLEDARNEALEYQLPMLVYVYSPDNEESVKLKEGILTSAKFHRLMTGFTLGEVNAAENPSFLQQYNLDQTPAFLVFDSSGALVRTSKTARTLKDFADLTLDVQ